uniref:YDG domain-containing protein n=1 Tax=Angiostrongylus cantonensis TaxID=6313 RepID=A0A0K0D1P6_ANGCA
MDDSYGRRQDLVPVHETDGGREDDNAYVAKVSRRGIFSADDKGPVIQLSYDGRPNFKKAQMSEQATIQLKC